MNTLKLLSLPILLFILVALNRTPDTVPHSNLLHDHVHNHVDHNHTDEVMFFSTRNDTVPDFPYKKTEAEWKEILTPTQYRILRKKGTEIPYTNEYFDNKDDGLYVCRGCGQHLYDSDHKYKSGTGWPSFWQPIDDSLVTELEDRSFFMLRTEIVCSNCGGHLGHVFDDGPRPTGLRYCMNSAAMKFIPRTEVPESD